MNHHAPPGWYPGPSESNTLRWWDGQRWTDHRCGYPLHPRAGSFAVTHANPPRQRSTVRNIAVAVLISIVVCGAALYTWNRHQANARWYQDGYALGSKAVTLVNAGTSVEGACGVAMIGEIRFGAANYSARKRAMERGCAQAVQDRRSP